MKKTVDYMYLKIIKNNYQEILAVLFISVFFTCISSAKYISQFIHKPNNSVFVGASHYYEDFYYYLDQFYQGADGKWLTENNFTSENLQPTPIYISHIILGKIGGIFGLESFQSYNLSLLIMKLLYFILVYIFIKKIFKDNIIISFISFLIFILSTSFPVVDSSSGSLVFEGSSIIFRAKNTFFSRFGNIPKTNFDNIVSIIILILSLNSFQNFKENHKSKSIWKINILIILLFILLSISDPSRSFLSLIFIFFGNFFHSGKSLGNFLKNKYLYILLLSVLIPSIYLYKFIEADLIYKQANLWDINVYINQIKSLNLYSFIYSFGTLGILYTVSIFMYFKSKINTPIIRTIVYTSLSGIFLFFAPYIFQLNFPGFRFLSSNTYILFTLAFVLIFIHLYKKINILFISLILIHFFISILTISSNLIQEIEVLQTPYRRFAYIPNKLFDGFNFIRNFTPKDSIILASPNMSTDLMIPGLTGRKTYTGHFLLNLNSAKKDDLGNKFFYEWTDPKEAKDFLVKNKINYIIHTKYSNNFNINELKTYYPFLIEVFKNEEMYIFTH